MKILKHEQLAWAGAFFEGEGWVGKIASYQYKTKAGHMRNCNGYRALFAQKHKDVLLQFQRCVKMGIVAGPYKSGTHCPMFYWRIGKRSEVTHLFKLLNRFLSPRRQQQFRSIL